MEHVAPTDDFAQKYRQLCRQAEHLAEVKRWHEARKTAHEAIRLNPTNHYAYCLYAYVLSKSDTSPGGLREALDYAEKGIRYSPEDEWGYRLRSVCLRQLGDIPAAIDAAKEAIRYDPYEPKTHYVLGWALIEAKAFDEAERVGLHLAELAPEWSSSFYLLGSVALNRKRNADAEAHFRRALEIEPDAPYLLNDLAVAVERQGRKAEAVEFYSLALKLSPDSRLYRENVRQGVTSQFQKNPAFLVPGMILTVGVILMFIGVRANVMPGEARLGFILVGLLLATGGGVWLSRKTRELKAGLNPVAAAVYAEAQEIQKRRNQAAILRSLAQFGVIFAGIIATVGWISLTGKLLGAWALVGIILIFGAGVYLWGRIPAPDTKMDH